MTAQAGKTFRVEALARTKDKYYSDESAVVDAECLVCSYAKPLSMRGTGDVATKLQVDDLGFRNGSDPLRAGLIVSARHEWGRQFSLRVVGRGRDLLLLIDNTVVVRARPRFAVEHLEPVARDAAVLEWRQGDSDAAAAYLLQCCVDNLPERKPLGL